MRSPPQLKPTRQLSADPAALESSLATCPPPPPPSSLSHKPVTPRRHRTGVTFSFCAALYILLVLRTLVFTVQVKLNKHAALLAKKVEKCFLSHIISQLFGV